MAVLKAAERNRLAGSDFGLPKQRKYPMPDKSHARNAKSRASEMEHEGRLSASEEAKIDRKANRILGKGSKRRAKKEAGKKGTFGMDWRDR